MKIIEYKQGVNCVFILNRYPSKLCWFTTKTRKHQYHFIQFQYCTDWQDLVCWKVKKTLSLTARLFLFVGVEFGGGRVRIFLNVTVLQELSCMKNALIQFATHLSQNKIPILLFWVRPTKIKYNKPKSLSVKIIHPSILFSFKTLLLKPRFYTTL